MHVKEGKTPLEELRFGIVVGRFPTSLSAASSPGRRLDACAPRRRQRKFKLPGA